ncbi:MAG: PRC-barrel domain-containing protein, partial [Clostridium sp.]|nr:PRC-barrel domain-containing protein [Clostridium sp.]
DVINEEKKLIGVLEDLIISKDDFTIKGLIISSGIFDKMFKGKEIITLKNSILDKEKILYKGNEGIKLKTLPHNLGGIQDVKKV